jgi:glutamate carboxypeptidase
MDPVWGYLQANRSDIEADLERLVKAESPSLDKRLSDLCGEELKKLFRDRLGLEAVMFPQTVVGDNMRFTYGEGDSQLLILSHFDTVWQAGRLTYRVEGNRAYGPGILDMKGGIVQSIWAVKALKESGLMPAKKIVFLCTSDEEIGSNYSRELIEQESKRSEAVLVPEPSIARTGALKTSRKSMSRYFIRIRGKAAHSGNHHEDGVSALEEMARQIVYLHSLTDYSKGTTINVGVAGGGTCYNVVAELAELDVDVRTVNYEEAERIYKLMMGLSPVLPGIQLQVEGGITRPPMERTAHTERLFQLAAHCGAELGLSLKEGSAGGGSDGNFAAALGIPTLDGLGAVGEGPHAEYEHVELDGLPVRAALLAKLLTRL